MFKKKITLNKEFFALIVIIIFSFFLWDTFIIYPVKLFVVVFHEAFHGFIALITGGSISSINVSLDLGGRIVVENGNDFLIAIAGYSGSLIIGMLFFLNAEKKYLIKILIYFLIVLIIIILANSIPSNEFIILSLIIILALISLSIFLENYYVKFFVKLIGILSMFYVLIDLRNDLLDSHYQSDGKILSSLTGVSTVVIALVWIILSGSIIFLSLKKIFISKT